MVGAFRKRLQSSNLRLTFALLRKQCEKQILLRYILSQKEAVRAKYLVKVGIYAFKKN